MPTRDVSDDVANVVEFCRRIGAGMEAPPGDGAPLDAVVEFMADLGVRELAMLLRGLTHIAVVADTPDSQVILTAAVGEEDRTAAALLQMERHGQRESAQLLTLTVVVESWLLAAQVATVLVMPIVRLVQSGHLSLDGLVSKGESG